jgi:hypothetical protein
MQNCWKNIWKDPQIFLKCPFENLNFYIYIFFNILILLYFHIIYLLNGLDPIGSGRANMWPNRPSLPFFVKWAGPDQPYGLAWNGSSPVRLAQLMAQQAFFFFFFLFGLDPTQPSRLGWNGSNHDPYGCWLDPTTMLINLPFAWRTGSCSACKWLQFFATKEEEVHYLA